MPEPPMHEPPMHEPPMHERLCLLSVHAHPDDEASKGAATVARYSDEGVHTVLVTCTGGEAGDILSPAADTAEARADLGAVRRRELDESVAAIGYDVLHLLGYHDSGMPDTEVNARPDNFANAPLDEAVGRLVRIIRAERPQVIITYGEDHTGYPHPDHIRVHEISIPAFEAAGDPSRYPDAGDPWQPLKMYYSAWSRGRIEALAAVYEELGLESPFQNWRNSERRGDDDRVTTRIEVGDWLIRRRAALLAHRTQIDPEGFWMRLPDSELRRVWPWEEFVLARSLVASDTSGGVQIDGRVYEDDLFAGIRTPVRD
jgi:mycothiol S-conjugate amidase